MRNEQYSAGDRGEKIRTQNEKKHQRQKEKRAKEKHNQCRSMLKTRKLESLAQQIRAKGFSQGRAEMALFINEGNVEKAIAWLLEGGNKEIRDQDKEHDIDEWGIDVSEELDRIKDIGMQNNASTPEVEQVVMLCEGDLDKVEEFVMICGSVEEAEDTLRWQKTEAVKNLTSSPGTVQTSDVKVPTLDAMLTNPAPKPNLISDSHETMWGTAVGSNPPLSYSSALATPVARIQPQDLWILNDLKDLQLGSGCEQHGDATQLPTTSPKQDPLVSDALSLPGLDSYYYHPSSHETCGVEPPVPMSSSCPPSNPLDSGSSSCRPASSSVHGSSSHPPYIADPNFSQRLSQGFGSLSASSSLGFFSGVPGSSSSSNRDGSSSNPHTHFGNVDWRHEGRGLLASQRLSQGGFGSLSASSSLGFFSGVPGSSSSSNRDGSSSNPQTHFGNVDWRPDRKLLAPGWSTSGGANNPIMQTDANYWGLDTMANSRQLGSFGPGVMANDTTWDIPIPIGPRASDHSRQLIPAGPSMSGNPRQLIGPQMRGNSRQPTPDIMDYLPFPNIRAGVAVPQSHAVANPRQPTSAFQRPDIMNNVQRQNSTARDAMVPQPIPFPLPNMRFGNSAAGDGVVPQVHPQPSPRDPGILNLLPEGFPYMVGPLVPQARGPRAPENMQNRTNQFQRPAWARGLPRNW